MAEHEPEVEDIDWRLTTWEGSRREQLRRWAELSLEEILLAQEEMEALSASLAASKASAGRPQDPLPD